MNNDLFTIDEVKTYDLYESIVNPKILDKQRISKSSYTV